MNAHSRDSRDRRQSGKSNDSQEPLITEGSLLPHVVAEFASGSTKVRIEEIQVPELDVFLDEHWRRGVVDVISEQIKINAASDYEDVALRHAQWPAEDAFYQRESELLSLHTLSDGASNQVLIPDFLLFRRELCSAHGVHDIAAPERFQLRGNEWPVCLTRHIEQGSDGVLEMKVGVRFSDQGFSQALEHLKLQDGSFSIIRFLVEDRLRETLRMVVETHVGQRVETAQSAEDEARMRLQRLGMDERQIDNELKLQEEVALKVRRRRWQGASDPYEERERHVQSETSRIFREMIADGYAQPRSLAIQIFDSRHCRMHVTIPKLPPNFSNRFYNADNSYHSTETDLRRMTVDIELMPDGKVRVRAPKALPE